MQCLLTWRGCCQWESHCLLPGVGRDWGRRWEEMRVVVQGAAATSGSGACKVGGLGCGLLLLLEQCLLLALRLVPLLHRSESKDWLHLQITTPGLPRSAQKKEALFTEQPLAHMWPCSGVHHATRDKELLWPPLHA